MWVGFRAVEVLRFIRRNRLLFRVLRENWLRPVNFLKHPAVTTSHRHPRGELTKGRVTHELMILPNLELTDNCSETKLVIMHVAQIQDYSGGWLLSASVPGSSHMQGKSAGSLGIHGGLEPKCTPGRRFEFADRVTRG